MKNQRPECTETFMLDYFYLKEFSLFSYYISDATLCKFIWINYSLIEIKSLNIDQYGLYHTILNIYDSILCVCVFSILGKCPCGVADIRENIKKWNIMS